MLKKEDLEMFFFRLKKCFAHIQEIFKTLIM